MTKTMVLFGNDLNELSEKMNDFFEGRNIISSPIYQEMNKGQYQYYCMVYYQSSQEKEELCSEAQLKLLWSKGYNGDGKNLTMKEADRLIKELLGRW